jgi:hypothetical protein
VKAQSGRTGVDGVKMGGFGEDMVTQQIHARRVIADSAPAIWVVDNQSNAFPNARDATF